jgi:hypothetical protein
MGHTGDDRSLPPDRRRIRRFLKAEFGLPDGTKQPNKVKFSLYKAQYEPLQWHARVRYSELCGRRPSQRHARVRYSELCGRRPSQRHARVRYNSVLWGGRGGAEVEWCAGGSRGWSATGGVSIRSVCPNVQLISLPWRGKKCHENRLASLGCL